MIVVQQRPNDHLFAISIQNDTSIMIMLIIITRMKRFHMLYHYIQSKKTCNENLVGV
jgi:hypothetical protein